MNAARLRFFADAQNDKLMYLIVGLGNPGDQYIHTRHNFGFEVLDHLAKKLEGGDWSLHKDFKAEIIKTPEYILVKPQTFMNNSGIAVSEIARYYKIKPEEIVIVHDELDLLLGHLKIRLGGSAAGHHGIESIIEKLGTDQFIRVRLGIGVDKALAGEHKLVHFNAEKFVIDHFTQSEHAKEKAVIKRATKALESLLKDGLEKSQNQFN